ncbi:hypothetical protein LTR53_010639, partial [Teratosphaeriaceae sp. CCFEE 6253]
IVPIGDPTALSSQWLRIYEPAAPFEGETGVYNNAGRLQTAPFALADLYTQPVPMSIYSSQPWCGQWAYDHSSILRGCSESVVSLLGWECPASRAYAPILIVPASVYAGMEFKWSECHADLQGVYDPLRALTPVAGAATVTTPAHVTVTATPAALMQPTSVSSTVAISLPAPAMTTPGPGATYKPLRMPPAGLGSRQSASSPSPRSTTIVPTMQSPRTGSLTGSISGQIQPAEPSPRLQSSPDALDGESEITATWTSATATAPTIIGIAPQSSEAFMTTADGVPAPHGGTCTAGHTAPTTSELEPSRGSNATHSWLSSAVVRVDRTLMSSTNFAATPSRNDGHAESTAVSAALSISMTGTISRVGCSKMLWAVSAVFGGAMLI